MTTANFTVAAKLLRELGERLVGKPSTALAELVKNAYDADAYNVHLVIRAGQELDHASGVIEIHDSGHGMSQKEFLSYWMRVGQVHKETGRVSPNLRRPYTGSKGIGRIAAMYLADKLFIRTISEDTPDEMLEASLDWREALDKKDLVDVEVQYSMKAAPTGSRPGTSLYLTSLKMEWSPEDLVNLGREIWKLQPPFNRKGSINDRILPREIPPMEKRGADDFRVTLEGPEPKLVSEFERQMDAVLALWSVRIEGEYIEGEVSLAMRFKGEKPLRFSYLLDNPVLRRASFDLRVFELQGRQPRGISVNEARDYLRQFGGVQIYDATFRLPHYGDKGNDWLLIAHDVSRRASLSELLPERLMVSEGLQSLPQWYQVLGQVNVNTRDEPGLEILATRDRLQDGLAFAQLRDIVRFAIHWYANEKRKRALAQAFEVGTAPSDAVDSIEQIVELHGRAISPDATVALREVVDNAKAAVRTNEEKSAKQIAALSTFATAGIAAMAYNHELSKQLVGLEALLERLDVTLLRDKKELIRIRSDLESWIGRARSLGAIFAHMDEPENVESERRYRCNPIVEDALAQLNYALSGIEIEVDLKSTMRFPVAAYAEWISVFQNLLFNASNAVQDREKPRIRISGRVADGMGELRVEDNGIGVDSTAGEGFFKPFARGLTLSPQRRAAGFGGTGLGLPIIRMICERRAVNVVFVKASAGFNTCLALTWSDSLGR